MASEVPATPALSASTSTIASSSPAPHRSVTLRVLDLLSTRVQSVRIELVGPGDSPFSRLGAVLLYLPLLVVGYLLMLAAVLKLVAAAVGWGLTFFMFGAVHLALAAWGMTRGSSPGAAKTYDVVDPALAETARAPARDGTADTLPDVHRKGRGGIAAAANGTVGNSATAPPARTPVDRLSILPSRQPARVFPTGAPGGTREPSPSVSVSVSTGSGPAVGHPGPRPT